jgi:hypothetical protein
MARLMSGNTGLQPPQDDLDRAYQALNGKLAAYNNLWSYYDGDQPLMYSSRRLEDLFKDVLFSTFVENWCAVIIDAANDRISLEEISLGNTSDTDALRLVWEDNNLDLEAKDVHEAALVIGEAFVIVWEDEAEVKRPDLYYNDPRLVHLFYEPSNPRKKWYGAKWWVGSDEHVFITLYYPDRLEYYKSDKPQGQVSNYKNFKPYSPDGTEGGEQAENPYGEVPIFHFRLERRAVKGDLVNVVPLQNGVNKLVTDMMVAAEYGAFRQRWIISNADTSELKNAPNEIWDIPAGDGAGQQASVGEFNPTDLNNYIQAVDHLATAAAIISRTPKHYLFAQGGDPSGEALIAMEAPLNKRCNDHIVLFIPVWREIVQFMLKVAGKEDVKRSEIAVSFAKPETIQPKTEAEVRQLGRNSGIPLITLLRDEGKDEAWLDQMAKDKLAEAEANKATLGQALLSSMRDSNEEEFPPSASDDQDDEGSSEPSV